MMQPVLDHFATASDDLLGRRTLLSRSDSKFILAASALDGLLDRLRGAYAVIRVAGRDAAHYDSLYFDTSTLRCFHDHRRGLRVRHKIRVRHYPDRALSFLEVKTRRSEACTDKYRLDLPAGHDRLGPRELAFLHERIGGLAEDLHPMLRIRHRRMTLIALDSNERVTIDLGLTVDGSELVLRRLGHLAIIEVKQSPFSRSTPVMRALRDVGLREASLSKYVTALALLRPELRCNRLLPALRALERT